MTSPPATERRQLTVVFTDLVGSTDLASALDPEDWHEVLDSYQHRVAAIVTSHGGVIAQFQGDGAIAYFGYPGGIGVGQPGSAVGRPGHRRGHRGHWGASCRLPWASVSSGHGRGSTPARCWWRR